MEGALAYWLVRWILIETFTGFTMIMYDMFLGKGFYCYSASLHLWTTWLGADLTFLSKDDRFHQPSQIVIYYTFGFSQFSIHLGS